MFRVELQMLQSSLKKICLGMQLWDDKAVFGMKKQQTKSLSFFDL